MESAKITNLGSIVNFPVWLGTLGLLGEPRVNVLRLNLALDERYPLVETSE